MKPFWVYILRCADDTLYIEELLPETFPEDPAELQKLKADRNIQAVLVVKLAGYGKLKKKWVTYLIGSGGNDVTRQHRTRRRIRRRP